MKKIGIISSILAFSIFLLGCGETANSQVDDTIVEEEVVESGEVEEPIEEEILVEKEKTITVEESEAGIVYTVDTALEDEEYVITQLPWPCYWGGAAYSIKTSDGKLIIYDGGFMEDDGEKIKSYVNENGGVVDAWIITHPHVDHVGAFIYNANAEDPITIKEVYYAPFTEEYFNDEDPEVAERLQYATLFTEFNEAVTNNNIPSTAVYQGDILEFGSMTIECLSGFRDELKDVNGNSLVLKCVVKDFTMLFTGDMTEATLAYMQEDYESIDVDFLQIPHHGYLAGIEGVSLYEYTTPEYTFLDCTEEEYDNNSVFIQNHVEMIEELGIKVIKRFEGINQIIIK